MEVEEEDEEEKEGEILEEDELLEEVLEVEDEAEVEEVGERVIEVCFGGPGFVLMSPASISSAAVHLRESRGQHGQKNRQ